MKVRKPQSIQVKSKKTQYNYKKGVKRSTGASAKGGVRLTYSSSNPKVNSRKTYVGDIQEACFYM